MYFTLRLSLTFLVIGIFSFFFLGNHYLSDTSNNFLHAQELAPPGPNDPQIPPNDPSFIIEPPRTEDPEIDPEDAPAIPPAHLRLRVIRTPKCGEGGFLTYRIVLTNTGGRPAVNITVRDRHPKMPIDNITPPAQNYNEAEWLITWTLSRINPGKSAEFSFRVPRILDRVDNLVEIEYFSQDEDGLTGPLTDSHYEIASENCSSPIEGDPAPNLPLLPWEGFPAIICAPQEPGCRPFMPTLGPKFSLSRAAGDNPILGVRYKEAIPDIVPGECRVIEDDIITTPEYHNSLNRQGNESAVYMRPLYNSTQDFKRLVHENTILGIKHNLFARLMLQKIHTKHWQRQASDITKVLNGSQPSDSVRDKVDQYHDDWIEETENAQEAIFDRYEEMQAIRREKFAPIAQEAIQNAETALNNACGQSDTSTLVDTLLESETSVKTLYDNILTARLELYETTQENYVRPDIDAVYLPQTWQNHLRQALNAFDQDDDQPLKNYLNAIPENDRVGFSATWSNSYLEHAAADTQADNVLRLNHWDLALQDPKTKVTDCAKEDLFGDHVVTTWCESGDYPELILRNAPPLSKKHANQIALPDLTHLDGSDTEINNTAGNACVEEPGNPWWADDCSCQCGELVVGPRGNPVACQQVASITRHDYFVTSKAECLNDGDKHNDPFF